MPTQNSTADIVSSQRREPASRITGPVAVHDRLFNPEFDLLLACCHSETKFLAAALKRDLRWDLVFKLAGYHRVLPALHARLQDRPDVPASIQSALRARFFAHCHRAMRFSAELVGIVKHFNAESIPVIAQKGPALAQTLYCDSSMREFGDLDLLVRPQDVHRACDALRDLGYDKQLELSPRQEKEYLRTGYEYVFGRGIERNLVELQWNLLPRFYAVDVSIDDLFRRSAEHEFESCQARVLGTEDQMLFLCLHAAKHQWAQLGMIRDIATLPRLKIDWVWVCDEARRLGITRILVISLLLAQEFLGVELPVALSRMPELAEFRKIAAAVGADVAESRELDPESAAYFRFMLRVRERWQDRVRFLWRLAVTSSVGEWSVVQVPDALFPLYFGVRLFRLVGRVAD